MERVVLCVVFVVVCFSFGNSLCSSHDSLSLLHFKHSLNATGDHQYGCPNSSYPKTTSWNMTSMDCCKWDGITCNSFTGHVIGLDLSCSRLEGTLHPNSSLFQLRHLQTLDLSSNDFTGSQIPQGIGQLVSLTHLNLSYSCFEGRIPLGISHLSKLVSLDLSDGCYPSLQFSHDMLNMLFQNLTKLEFLSLYFLNISSNIPMNVSFSSSLRYLNIARTNLQGDLPKSIFLLPKLETLRLSENHYLTLSLPDYFSWSRTTHSLRELDLSFNNVSGGIPNSLGNTFKALKILRLSMCSLAGPFPEFIGQLSQITQLDLSHNNLDGKIPDVFYNLQMLTSLSLDNNNFTGPFPPSLVNLTNLQVLRLRNNSLSGTIPEFKTNSIEILDLSRNQFSGPIPQSLTHLLNLTAVFLGQNKLSGEVGAEMFSSMKNLQYLDLSLSGLSWSGNSNTTFPLLSYLALRSCGVKDFPDFIFNSKDLWVLDLSENEIHGQFPKWFGGLSALQFLNVSHNFLTSLDHIPWVTMMILDLQSNSLTGPLPSPICTITELYLINLSYNNLMGEIPNCLFTSSSLKVLNLQANNFHGPIPNKFPDNSALGHINLSKNQLEGPIPTSLVNCTSLRVLDLGNNKIHSTFPSWLETLQQLELLILKSNRFYGPIVAFQTKLPFSNMKIFDLSNNSFTGSLPMEILKGFKDMDAHKSGLEYYVEETISLGSYFVDESLYSGLYVESVILVMKNQETKFNKMLKMFTTIDLSRNKFEGEIPKFIGNLNSLLLLNLSHNSLTGHIPVEMKNMSTLEALDLSFNQLTGKIPEELASLTFLAVLNLSHNHLAGPIPQSNQFNTFQNDSYLGNSELCGFPLSNECGKHKSASVPVEHEEDEPSFLSEMTWQSVLIGYGCGLTFGFGIVYLIYLFERPRWFINSFETITHEMIYIIQRARKRRRRNFHTENL
ncbi:receptor-like protein 9DC1 [Solanum pennellii]|uniref:Receptor-like protein 9DC1 n=1 Tax=Solanum pennellii TaxID=28526 RepID=A0ABM1HL40_SOLPN|nr:receptor-like protein 9DC1 [Solanum pennellii]